MYTSFSVCRITALALEWSIHQLVVSFIWDIWPSTLTCTCSSMPFFGIGMCFSCSDYSCIFLLYFWREVSVPGTAFQKVLLCPSKVAVSFKIHNYCSNFDTSFTYDLFNTSKSLGLGSNSGLKQTSYALAFECTSSSGQSKWWLWFWGGLRTLLVFDVNYILHQVVFLNVKWFVSQCSINMC